MPSTPLARTLLAAALFSTVLAPAPARAHGGRPQTYDVLFTADPNDLIVPATFGVMSTTDGGAHWDWLCIEGMPDARRGHLRPAVRAPDDSIFFAQHFGLMVGADRDCSPAYDTELRERYVADVVARPGGGYAAVSSDGTVANSLYVSETGREAFMLAGAPLPVGFLPERLRYAAGDPMHVYVSGETLLTGTTYSATVFESVDGGASWTAHDVPFEDGEHVLRALAVDPTDPDRLFVVAQGAVSDRVIELTDGGTTQTTVAAFDAVPLAADRPMAFAFLPDGSMWLGNTEAGLYRIDAAGELHLVDKFLRVACIVPHGEDIYLCGDGLDDDFALGVQRMGEAYAPTPLMVFSQLDEQRLCGTAIDAVCADWWDDLLLDTGRAALIPDSGVRDAGTDAARLDSGMSSDGAVEVPAPRPSCACGATTPVSPRGALLALSVVLGMVWSRRR